MPAHKLKDAKQLGAIIREARRREKVTQQALADFTGLHRNGIRKVEAGQSEVRLGTLLRIAKLLHLRVMIESDAE